MQITPQPLFAPPAAREEKPPFNTLPDAMREKIERRTGGHIVSGETIYGSLSSSAGFVLTFDSGLKVFAKGSHPDEMSHGTLHIRREIKAYEDVAVLRDIAPQLYTWVSDNDEDGWTLGVWKYIPGSDADVGVRMDEIMPLLAQAHRAEIAPGIVPEAAAHNYLSMFLTDTKKWRRIQSDVKIREKFLTLFEDVGAGEAWLTQNIDALMDLQARAASADFVQGFMHGDLRLDNIIGAQDRCYIVDWPNACTGPVLFDLVMLAGHIEAMGHAPAEKTFDVYRAAGGTALAGVDPENIVMMTALLAGYFADQAYRTVPPKLPRLRWMQKSLLCSHLRLLARLSKIESPPRMQGQDSI